MAALRHPNCVSFFAVCHDPPCMVTGEGEAQQLVAHSRGLEARKGSTRAVPATMLLPRGCCCKSSGPHAIAARSARLNSPLAILLQSTAHAAAWIRSWLMRGATLPQRRS